MTSNFKRLVKEAGFDARKMRHHCNRLGMATTLMINECVKKSDVFLRESVATLCLLGRWSKQDGTWA
ncbi:unnamed protein product, partial [Porites lobata]